MDKVTLDKHHLLNITRQVILGAIFFIQVLNNSQLPVQNGEISIFLKIVLFFMFLFLFFSTNFVKISFFRFAELIAICVLVLISTLNSGIQIFLILLVLIISTQDMNYRQAVRGMMFGQMVGVLFVLLILMFNIIPNIQTTRLNVIRYSLGFLNPNTISDYILAIFVKYAVAYGKDMKLKFIFGFNVFDVLIIYFSDSRTNILSLIVFDVLLFLLWITRRNKRNIALVKKMMSSFTKFLVLFLLFVTIIIGNLFSTTSYFWSQLNLFFSARLSSIYNFMHDYGISIFGRKVELVSSYQASVQGLQPKILDNSFAQLMIIFGLFILIIFIVFYFKIIDIFFEKNLLTLLVASLLYSMISFSSGNFLAWDENVSLIVGGILLFQNYYLHNFNRESEKLNTKEIK